MSMRPALTAEQKHSASSAASTAVWALKSKDITSADDLNFYISVEADERRKPSECSIINFHL